MSVRVPDERLDELAALIEASLRHGRRGTHAEAIAAHAALVADLRAARADNQRLRESLGEIAGHVAVDECEPDYCHWRRTLTLAGTALAALAEEPRA